jgi:hypothetical protein
MTGEKTMQTLRALFACIALAASTAACHGQASEYCDVKCDCIGCSDANYDECVINYEAQADTADAYDCGDKFDDRHECIMSKYDCVSAIDVFDEGAVACADDYADLAKCVDDGSSRF